MKGFLLSLGLLACCFAAWATPQNMDFSEITDGKPSHWYIDGTEAPTLSTVASLDNATAIKISRNDNTASDFADVSQQIKFPYAGDSVSISGYIKTTAISADGFVGFWLSQASENDEVIHFKNMELQAVNGSRDWQHYTLSAEIDPDTELLYFGIEQSGTGSSEYAKLKLTIDGKPLSQAPAKERKVYPAELSHKFERDSGIRLAAIDQQQHANLAALAKVWGFVKYYHPESAAGNISMDAELFKLIPKVLKADPKARDQLLVKWINGLGALNGCKKCKDSTNAALAHPAQHWLAWQLSPELNAVLARVYNAELPVKHYWVRPAPNVGNPAFNEKSYADISYEDSGYRLLTVFRLWNIINYYSPYRDVTEQPWQQVLPSAITEVISATTEVDYQLALANMVSSIDDTHSQFGAADFGVLKPYIGKNIAPIDVRFVEHQVVVYQVYQPELPIKIGDVITHINDKPVNERQAHLRPLAAASNEPTRFKLIARLLLRDNAEQLKVQVQRGTESLQLQLPLVPLTSIERQRYYYNHGETAYHRLTPDIGYIRLDKIADVNIDDMMHQLADTKGLVIDIRNYPSDFVVFSLGEHLYPLPYNFVSFTRMEPANPGQFNWSPPLSIGTANPNYYRGKVAILVDEQSISQSEYTTMAFRGAPKAKVIGSTTAGADGNTSFISLPGGHRTYLSGIGVFYPDKTPTQRIGIVPDIEVKPTIAGIAAGRDEQLEAAIEYIKQQ